MDTKLALRQIVALAALTLIASAVFGANVSSARASCPVVHFGKTGKALLSGIAPADDVLCFRLKSVRGSRISLRVLRGENIFFSIVNVTDAQDRFAFVADTDRFRLIVGQLLRSVQPQAFRIMASKSCARI